MNIVHLHPHTVTRLTEAASYADLHGTRLRIMTGEDASGPYIKWDCGNGAGWTPPYYDVDSAGVYH